MENLNEAVEASKEIVENADGNLVKVVAGCAVGVPVLALGTYFLCKKVKNKIKSRKQETKEVVKTEELN